MSKRKKTSIGPAESWQEVPAVIEARPALYSARMYGISMSISGSELWVDFGDELGSDICLAKLIFRDEKKAWTAYCKGIRLELKVVKHPEHS